MKRDELIRLYFELGLSNKEILECFAIGHNRILSNRTLKRITSGLSLYRRKHQSDIVKVASFIFNEIANKTVYMHGYRWMHSKCIQAGFVVSERAVRMMIGILDREGLFFRRRHRLRRWRYGNNGPNAVWHIDGCDKLAPYGIYIHGCVDGFSRHTIWMRVSKTNKDPAVIAGYYVNAIEELNKCPRVVRADCGTVNGTICELQRSMRRDHSESNSGDNSFLYGKSVTNQRI